MVDVNENGWLGRGAALPTFDSGKEPELSSGRPHVDEEAAEPSNKSAGRDERRPGLPALRLPWRLQLQVARLSSSARLASINSASQSGTIFASRKLPIQTIFSPSPSS